MSLWTRLEPRAHSGFDLGLEFAAFQIMVEVISRTCGRCEVSMPLQGVWRDPVFHGRPSKDVDQGVGRFRCRLLLLKIALEDNQKMAGWIVFGEGVPGAVQTSSFVEIALEIDEEMIGQIRPALLLVESLIAPEVPGALGVLQIVGRRVVDTEFLDLVGLARALLRLGPPGAAWDPFQICGDWGFGERQGQD